MGTTAEKLAYLADTKTAIKNAIVAKGIEVLENTTFREYADKIGKIEQSSGITNKAFTLYINKENPHVDPVESFSSVSYNSATKIYIFSFSPLPEIYGAAAMPLESMNLIDGGVCITLGKSAIKRLSISSSEPTCTISLTEDSLTVIISDRNEMLNGEELKLYIVS